MNPEGEDFYHKESAGTAVAEPPPAPAAVPTAPPTGPAGGGSITWAATEYTHHDRGASWYALLFLGTVGLAAAVYFLTKDYFATGSIVVLGIIVGAFAVRKPGQITYELSDSGLRVGQKLYSFNQFKSFSITHDGVANSVSLLPLKKFMPPVDAYFGPGDEEKITDLLGKHLPYEQRKAPGIDRLSRKLKF
jgi:hypothetical protein